MANQLAKACFRTALRVLVGMTLSSVAVSESSSCPPTRRVLVASSACMSNGFVVTNISCSLGWTRSERGGGLCNKATGLSFLCVRPSGTRLRRNAGCAGLVVIASSEIRRRKRSNHQSRRHRTTHRRELAITPPCKKACAGRWQRIFNYASADGSGADKELVILELCNTPCRRF